MNVVNFINDTMVQQCYAGNTVGVKLALEQGANPEATSVRQCDEAERSALQMATLAGHKDIVKLLKQYGVSTLNRGEICEIMLDIAVYTNDYTLMSEMIKLQGNPTVLDRHYRIKAIELAEKAGHNAIAVLLKQSA